MIFVDLLLDNHDIVRIECPGRFEDELHDSLENAIRRRDEWSTGTYDGVRATINGILISRVNMARVIGRL